MTININIHSIISIIQGFNILVPFVIRLFILKFIIF